MDADTTSSFLGLSKLLPWEQVAVTPLSVDSLDRWTENALARGATMLVLRLGVPFSMEELWRWAQRWEGVRWLWHSRSGPGFYGHGKHFTASDTPPTDRPHPSYLFGRSCHNLLELEEATTWADYAWLGHFYQTASHPLQAPLPLSTLQEAVGRFPNFPIIAIGGFTSPDRIEKARALGARGFASIQYFLA
jgi:thiamine monophosphate synthase